MGAWWSALSGVNQGFFFAAAFFSVLAFWQFVTALTGLASDHDAEPGIGHDPGDAAGGPGQDAAHGTVDVFKLVSVRSILAFCTLFSWAGGLYLSQGTALGTALGYSLLWGAGGFVAVGFLVNLLRSMAESGTPRIETCVGTEGTIYLDVPTDGEGEVRAVVGGTLTHLKARSVGGHAISAGTPVRVVRVLGPGTVEVDAGEKKEPYPQVIERKG